MKLLTNDKKFVSKSAIQRFSGVELLKIIAIFLICISHAVQTSNQFVEFETTLNFTNVILRILRYSGQIGNILFVISSAWFLVDSKKTKWNKVFSILFDSMLISIFIMLGFVFAGYKMTSEIIVKQIFPDIFKNVWFIPAYIVFYILHPVLNFVISKINQYWHLALVILMIIILGVITEIFNINYNASAIQFVYVYFVVAYFKKYHIEFCDNKKANITGFVLFFVMFLLFAISKYLMFFVQNKIGNNAVVDSMISPILFPSLFCLFNLFRLMRIRSKGINYIASCSLFIYCIHENVFVRGILRPQYYSYVFGINSSIYFWWILLCGLGMFIGAYIIAIIYKQTIHKAVVWFSNKIGKTMDYCWGKFIVPIFNKLFKI